MYKRAITFIRRDEPVARTVASGEGILLDLNENGEIVALEFHERRGMGSIQELVAEHPDLPGFLDEVQTMFEEFDRKRSQSLSRRQIASCTKWSGTSRSMRPPSAALYS